MARYIRFEHEGTIITGELEAGKVHVLENSLFSSSPIRRTGAVLDEATIKKLAPCEPPKILAVGQNYTSHLGERKTPSKPEMFYKPTSSIQDPEGPVELPSDAEDVHYEGELVVVIGKRLRNGSAKEAHDAIFGVTIGNDISDRNWQRGAGKDVQYWRAKGCDTFTPLGPEIVTGLDYANLLLTTRLNGEVVQQQRTSDLIFSIPDVLSFVSRYVTLVPGDLVFTGTPGNTRAMKPGDVVEVEIEGIGLLRNPITARQD